ncbi:MAG: thiamine pyrophosphate-binding protein [Paludibacteraceae bacterium]|nr:thiamine pyrophosphate-binding protein [Paludibacteraceae bacterium]
MRKIKLSDYLFVILEKLGIKHVFYLPGGGAMHLVDSLSRSSITPVCMLHEQAAGIAADAYGQLTDELGVCLVTTGPGVTNAITAATAAWLDSTPCLFISGQVKTTDLNKTGNLRQYGFQQVNTAALVAPVVKQVETLLDPALITKTVFDLIKTATTGRKGPVWLDIPLDIQAAILNYNDCLAEFYIFNNTLNPIGKYQYYKKYSDNTLETNEDKLSYQAAMVARRAADDMLVDLRKSNNPVVLIGNGLRSSSKSCWLKTFLEELARNNIPLLATWRAMDMCSQWENYIGLPGSVGQRAANFALQGADFVLSIGARLDLGQTGYRPAEFAPNAVKYVVDIDQDELNKIENTKKVQIDARIFLEILHDKKELFPKKDIKWLQLCQEWKKKYRVIPRQTCNEYVDPYEFINILSGLLQKDDIVVPGSSGGCAEITMQHINLPAGTRILNNPGLGSMGFGLPAAIGAAHAKFGLGTVVCIEGDGSLQLNIQELATLSALKKPIVVYVWDNSGYASIRSTQEQHFNMNYVGSTKTSGLNLPNLKRVCKAYGLHTIEAYGYNADVVIPIAYEEASRYSEPVVCIVKMPMENSTVCKVTSKVSITDDHKATMVTSALDDLWPFLPESELNEIRRHYSGSLT